MAGKVTLVVFTVFVLVLSYLLRSLYRGYRIRRTFKNLVRQTTSGLDLSYHPSDTFSSLDHLIIRSGDTYSSSTKLQSMSEFPQTINESHA